MALNQQAQLDLHFTAITNPDKLQKQHCFLWSNWQKLSSFQFLKKSEKENSQTSSRKSKEILRGEPTGAVVYLKKKSEMRVKLTLGQPDKVSVQKN